MRLWLERRPEHSQGMAIASPFIAVALMLVTGGIIFTLIGLNPFSALYVYFIDPVTSLWSIEELLVKAGPLVLIAVGLAVGYSANVWNIGAEGQFVAGAVAGSLFPVLFPAWQDPTVLPVMLLMGILGGMAWGAIPAFLKTRFGASEILSSLMLVYVAQLGLDWLVRGPWRDPQGFNFPTSVNFDGWQLLPTLAGSGVHLGVALALIAAIVLAVVMGRMLKGFEIRVIGSTPRAGAFAGFSRERTVWFCFLLSGGLAGLAGICEVAGPIGHLQPSVSPGYGFTAIIVAFLGRLNPLGAVVAGLMLALSYLGGEGAQVEFGLSSNTAHMFQGILLFYILACDTLINYRIRLTAPGAAGTSQ